MRKLIILFTLFTCFISFGQLRVIEDNNYNPTLLNEAIPFYNNGVVAIKNKKYNLAIENLKEVIVLDPYFTDAYDMIAVAYRRINQLDTAIEYYKRSLKIFPKNRLAQNNLGMTYIQDYQYIKAEEVYKNLLNLNGISQESSESKILLNAEPYYGLCRVYFYENKYDLAIFNGNKAYDVWKQDLPLYASDALYLVALSYLNKGDETQGVIVLRQSATLGNKNAQNRLQDY